MNTPLPRTMQAVRLHAPGDLRYETVETPALRPGDALVEVHAAAITRNELEWPVDRLPAVPSYEVSGVVAAIAPEVESVAVGDALYGLTSFDRNGAAATYAAVPAKMLAPKPTSVGHVEAAAIPMPALTAWQGLFDRGGLQAGERVVILGATGGVGHVATQLARHRGAHVVGVSRRAAEIPGADEVVGDDRIEDAVATADLVFDTAGGDALRRSAAALRGGRLVSVAEEPPAGAGIYFVVEQSGEQLREIARLVDEGALRVAIDSTFPLSEAPTAFERSLTAGKRGKVVLEVAG